MGTIHALKRKFESLDTGKIITEVMVENAPLLGEINLSQLYAGKTRLGTDLSPTYQEDPYFDTRGGLAAAQAYSDWKDRITPNRERRPGVPNLIINGFYYASRKVVVTGNTISYGSDYLDLTTKYGEEIDGLGGKYKLEFLETVNPAIKAAITAATGLKFGK